MDYVSGASWLLGWVGQFSRRMVATVMSWMHLRNKQRTSTPTAENSEEQPFKLLELTARGNGAGPGRRYCRGTLPLHDRCFVHPLNTDISMPRSSHSGIQRDKSSTTKPSSDWRIPVGDTQTFSRSNPTRLSTEDRDVEAVNCCKGSTHWFDVFKERYQTWTNTCRGSIGDLFTLASPEKDAKRLEAQEKTRRSFSCETRAEEKRQRAAQRRASGSFASSVVGKSLQSPKKVIYFIRHGTAYCNVCRYTNWMVDQRLTPRGWNQVAALRAHVARIPPPEVVFTSTLSRAMETACGAFGVPISSLAHSELLMAPQESVYNLQSLSRGVAQSATTPLIIASEECRERMGDGVVPNKRRSLSDAKKQFPGIDFTNIRHEEDLLFERYERPDGETDIDIALRASRFTRFLLNRKESRIAVVSHGHFLSALLKLHLGGEEFCNAELRVYKMNDDTYTSTMPDLWFKPEFGYTLNV